MKKFFGKIFKNTKDTIIDATTPSIVKEGEIFLKEHKVQQGERFKELIAERNKLTEQLTTIGFLKEKAGKEKYNFVGNNLKEKDKNNLKEGISALIVSNAFKDEHELEKNKQELELINICVLLVNKELKKMGLLPVEIN